MFVLFVRVDDLFSTWRPDTEIMRIARHELTIADADPEVREVLELCERVHRETDGAFDITFGRRSQLPPHDGSSPIDPSGLVKGWAVQRAADRLASTGAKRFWINAGGDIVARGRPDDGPWRIGLQHPWERDKLAAVVGVVDRAVATSGVYERGDHVIDPLTGAPVRGLTAVTVIGDDLTFVDAYATAVLVLGRPGLEWIASARGLRSARHHRRPGRDRDARIRPVPIAAFRCSVTRLEPGAAMRRRTRVFVVFVAFASLVATACGARFKDHEETGGTGGTASATTAGSATGNATTTSATTTTASSLPSRARRSPVPRRASPTPRSRSATCCRSPARRRSRRTSTRASTPTGTTSTPRAASTAARSR